MITSNQRQKLSGRSDDMCEAMVRIKPGVYARCGVSPVEAHHLLTRARGGGALDRAGEIYHLIHLCRFCHAKADGEEAYEGKLLIEGYATWNDALHRPVYEGPDIYLSEKYGRPT